MCIFLRRSLLQYTNLTPPPRMIEVSRATWPSARHRTLRALLYSCLSVSRSIICVPLLRHKTTVFIWLVAWWGWQSLCKGPFDYIMRIVSAISALPHFPFAQGHSGWLMLPFLATLSVWCDLAQGGFLLRTVLWPWCSNSKSMAMLLRWAPGEFLLLSSLCYSCLFSNHVMFFFGSTHIFLRGYLCLATN